MKLEEALPALRQGATILLEEDETQITNDMRGDKITVAQLLNDNWSVELPARAEGHADANSREASTADRPVPGFGGFVTDISKRDVYTSEGRSFLDSLAGDEIKQIDGRWLYVDPSLPKVNG